MDRKSKGDPPRYAMLFLRRILRTQTRQVLGLSEGRSSLKWQDYSLDGHQIVCHLVSKDYRCQDFVNPVGEPSRCTFQSQLSVRWFCVCTPRMQGEYPDRCGGVCGGP